MFIVRNRIIVNGKLQKSLSVRFERSDSLLEYFCLYVQSVSFQFIELVTIMFSIIDQCFLQKCCKQKYTQVPDYEIRIRQYTFDKRNVFGCTMPYYMAQYYDRISPFRIRRYTVVYDRTRS